MTENSKSIEETTLEEEVPTVPIDEEVSPAEGGDHSDNESGRLDHQIEEYAKKFPLSGIFKDWFLDYSSYVILQRAVPNIVDGLKPVQRRVLHAMSRMDDGAYTKVANIVGQAMQFHPHGDQSILGALVTLGQKGFTVDCQGNWGNILTGDSSAAPRYIEARLSKFAKEVMFDSRITHTMKSYDGRNDEPTELPVRFPLLLAQGTDGIAVGLASKILPHNFNELLEASVAILEGRDYELYPDFPTGGSADCSRYMDGKRGGSVKVRARIEKVNKNTLVISELPYGKTTRVLIDSIIKAKESGKIKIKKIDDMTTDRAEIMIHLPADVSPDKTIDALYAFTDCEFNISPNACVIVDNKPKFLSVKDILQYSTLHTRDLLLAQLRIRMDELEREWHYCSLEKVFFENRIYKVLEQDQQDWDEQVSDIFNRMMEFQNMFRREILMEDILRLVEKPVRKISKFDTRAMDEKIVSIEKEMASVAFNIENIDAFTINWFNNLRNKYGKAFPRRTVLTGFESIAATKVVNNNAKLYANLQEGFVGTDLKKDDGAECIGDCSDLSEIIVIARSGQYKIAKVGEKDFFWKDLLYAGVFNRGDSRTVYNAIYRQGKTSVYYAKRFCLTSVTRDKIYDITTGEEGSQLTWLSVNHNGEAETVKVILRPRPKLKKTMLDFCFANLAIKGRDSRGNLVTKFAVNKVLLRNKGVSTISGKDIWFDDDIRKLNEDGRGQHLGQFTDTDRILVICNDGTYYTTSFDLVNKYQGDIRTISKLDPDRVYTALYFDGEAKAFYVKRFSFPPSDNTPVSFISDTPKSCLVDISEDLHPRYEVIWKIEEKPSETVEAEEWISKKGVGAKGKRCVDRGDVRSVHFIEPLHKPEDDIRDEVPEDNMPSSEVSGKESDENGWTPDMVPDEPNLFSELFPEE